MKILNFSGFGGGSARPAGSAGEIQYNDGGTPAQLAASADLTWDDTGKVLEIGGDIDLNDGGTYTTTLQTVTPTQNRTISFPDATGTVALVAGSSGQLIYNNAGAQAGVSTMTFDGTSVTLAGRLINSYTSVASSPAKVFTGTWFTGGTSTTTKPHFLVEPTGTTSTAWSTSGTGLGVNAGSGFTGNLLDLQVNGTSLARIQSTGNIVAPSISYPDIALANGQSITIGAQNNTSGNFSGGDIILRAGSGQGSGTGGRLLFRPNNVLTSVLFCSVGSTFQELRQAANSIISWTSGTNVDATGADTGLTRSAAGVIKVTNGSTGDGTISGQLRAVGTAPAATGSTGTAGDIRYDSDYIYVCTATNTWKRAALATW